MPAEITSGCAVADFGFLDSLLSVGKLVILHGPVGFFSWRVSARTAGRENVIRQLLVGSLYYLLAISLISLVLPMSYGWLLIGSLVLGAAGLALGPGVSKGRDEAYNDPRHYAGAAALIVFMIIVLAYSLIYVRFDDDPLIYQLRFAAAWLQSGDIHIVPTPFHDPSQAYGPGLASVFYAWLIAPFGTDILGQAGGWFFALPVLLSSILLARELGAGKGLAWSAAAFLIMSPLFVYQSGSAYSDLPLAAFLTASIYFLLRAIRHGTGVDVLFAFLSAGLMAATKYTAFQHGLVLLPLFVIALYRTRTSPRWWAFGIVLALAACGWWYGRNLVLTGNPFFPIETIGFSGLFGSEEMKDWVFHQESGRIYGLIIENNVSLPMLLIGLGSLAALVYTTVKERTTNDFFLTASLVYAAITPIVIDMINWQLAPFQLDRFWLPAVPILCAVMAAALSRRPTLLLGGIALSYAGYYLRSGSALSSDFWTMVKVALPASAMIGGLSWMVLNRREKSVSVLPRYWWGVPVILLLLFIVITAPSFLERRTESLSGFIYGEGWNRLGCMKDADKVAVTGSNLFYPAHGPFLENEVHYFGLSGRVDPLAHQIMKDDFPDGTPEFQNPEPALERLLMCPRKWAESLVQSEVDALFIMRVNRTALINTAHDPEGWPIEDIWARENPALFENVYADDTTKIYRVERGMAHAAKVYPADCIVRPPDAIRACKNKDASCARFFPRAPLALKELEELKWVYALTF